MATISVTPLVDGVITAAQVNAIVNTIVTEINGYLSNGNVSVSADIDGSKLADATITSRKIKPTAGVVRATSNLALSASYQDVPGATSSITCDVTSTIIVTAFFDIQGITNGSGAAYGALSVDGTVQTGLATISSSSSSAIRGTVGCVWSVDVTAAAHTVKLQSKTTAVAGAEQCNTVNTCFFYEVISR